MWLKTFYVSLRMVQQHQDHLLQNYCFTIGPHLMQTYLTGVGFCVNLQVKKHKSRPYRNILNIFTYNFNR